jgi:trans-aconitate 2-methyltransferase
MTEWDAAEYARRSSLQEAMAQEVLALLDLDDADRILDVGCGEGKVTAQIAGCAPNASVVGVDPSHDMIGFAQSHHTLPNLRFQMADARSLPFQDEFDFVVSFNALHWVPDQEAALRSIHAAMVNGGKAQLRLVPAGPRKSVETVVEEIRRTPKWKAYFANFNDPYLRLTPEEYVALAERTGFRVIHVSTKDHAWDFGSRSAFAGFCAVGCVAWTNRLPAAERINLINDVVERYGKAVGERENENIFKFYQMDIALEKIPKR